MPAEEDRFGARDLPMVLTFIVLAILTLAFVVLSFARGSLVGSPIIYVLGGIVGLVLLLLGVNGLVRIVKSPSKDTDD